MMFKYYKCETNHEIKVITITYDEAPANFLMKTTEMEPMLEPYVIHSPNASLSIENLSGDQLAEEGGKLF